MIASCSHLLCDAVRYVGFGEALRAIRDRGFSAIDVGAFERWGEGLSPARLADDPDFFESSVRLLGRSGLTAVSVNCAPGPDLLGGDESSFDRYATELAALVALAREIGCDRMTLQIPARPEGWSDQQCADSFVEAWSRLVDRVDVPDGLRLSVEAHARTFMETPPVALGVVRRLWPAVGLTYDPSHQLSLGIPLEDTVEMFDYLVHVHVRDARLGSLQVVYGEGDLDLHWVLRHAADVGHEAVSVEHFSGFDPEFASTLALKADIEAFEG